MESLDKCDKHWMAIRSKFNHQAHLFKKRKGITLRAQLEAIRHNQLHRLLKTHHLDRKVRKAFPRGKAYLQVAYNT